MATSKYPAFSRSKNPFNKNTRAFKSNTKKGSVIFDENYNGIITTANIYTDNYYETVNNLGYYAIENDSVYYQDISGSLKNTFHVNYIQDI